MKGFLISLVISILSTLAIQIDSYHSDGRLISVHLSENWIKAFSKCNSSGATLASTEDLKQLDSGFWQQQGLLNEELWTSDTFIHTPFITKIGCFQMQGSYDIVADLKDYGNASVAVCYAFCSKSQYFALSGFNCICNPSKNKTMKTRQNCSSPDATERQKMFELYQVSSDKISGKKTTEIYYNIFECRKKFGDDEASHGSVPSSSLSNIESFHGTCVSSKDEILPIPQTFYDWESANTACEEQTGQPLATKLNKSHCQILKKKLSINTRNTAAFMTGKRTYRSQILVPDVLGSGVFELVHCKTFNRTKSSTWTEFDISKEEKCNEGKRHFICIEVSDTATRNEYGSKLMMKIMTPLLFLLIVSIFACAVYRIRVHLRRNQETKPERELETNEPYPYNHTESSQRISVKKEGKVYTCDSEDSGEDSYFSEDPVEAESKKLNEEVVVVTPTKSDDSCNYSYASACPHTPLQDITTGANVLSRIYANGAIPQDSSFEQKTLFAEGAMANDII